jgi:hypothetical protein
MFLVNLFGKYRKNEPGGTLIINFEPREYLTVECSTWMAMGPYIYGSGWNLSVVTKNGEKWARLKKWLK